MKRHRSDRNRLTQESAIRFWSNARPILAIGLFVLTIPLLNPPPGWQASSPLIDDMRDMIGWTGIFMFPAAGWVVAAGLRDRAKAKVIRYWPKAPGVVLTSAAELVYAGSGIFLKAPKVTYRYTVAGRSFENGFIQTARGAYQNWAYAKSVVVKYSPGTPVAVIYNPDEPEDSYLEVESDTASRKIEVGIFYAVMPIALGLFSVWLNARY